MYNEQELLLAVSRGNEQAFRQLILQYSALLHSFIYRHTESRELAEENCARYLYTALAHQGKPGTSTQLPYLPLCPLPQPHDQ